MNKAALLFVLSLTSLCLFSSCTSLQWRATDTEIREDFKAQNIPTRISYFEVDSLELKVRVQHIEGSGKTVNLVFFHGSPSSLSAWNGYLMDTILIAKANMYAIDRPGYGYSNFGDEMPSIDLQAQIMSGLIDAYQLKNVIAVGSSYGGPLVARMAGLNENIKSIVMISPAIDPGQEKKFWASRLTQWWITRWMVPTSYRVAGDEKTVHIEELSKIEEYWSLVKIPVLHIHGDLDDIVPYGNVDYTARKFSDIRIITLTGTGHEIAWGRPDLIKPYLLELIESISNKPSESFRKPN